jgi:hypothetical protein
MHKNHYFFDRHILKMYKNAALLVSLIGIVSAVPCHNCTDSGPLTGAAPEAPPVKQSCSEVGKYACLGNDSAVCNVDMTWAITKCGDGTRCMPDDYECIPNSDWDRWYEVLHPPKPQSTSTVLTAPSPTPEYTCETHGQWTCIDANTGAVGGSMKDRAVCNWGKWVVYECEQGHTCLENDWECVPEQDLESWASRIKPAPTTTETPLAAAPTVSPPAPVSCDVHGQWTCFNSESNSAGVGSQYVDLAQCNWGTLVVTKCVTGTSCLQNDWECVPTEDHAAWTERLNAAQNPSGAVESESPCEHH